MMRRISADLWGPVGRYEDTADRFPSRRSPKIFAQTVMFVGELLLPARSWAGILVLSMLTTSPPTPESWDALQEPRMVLEWALTKPNLGRCMPLTLVSVIYGHVLPHSPVSKNASRYGKSCVNVRTENTRQFKVFKFKDLGCLRRLPWEFLKLGRPHYRTQYTTCLILGTPNKVFLSLGKH